MKVGITQIILGNMSLADTLRLCEDAGYQAVELVFAEGKDLDPSMSADEIAQVGQQCAAAGVEIGSVIAWYQERGNLLSRDAGERERCLKCLRRSLEIAGALSVDGVLLHPGQLAVEGHLSAGLGWVAGRADRYGPLSRGNGGGHWLGKRLEQIPAQPARSPAFHR